MGVLKAKGAKAVAKAVEAKVKAAKAQARGGRLLRTGRQQVCVLDTASERSVTSQSVVITSQSSRSSSGSSRPWHLAVRVCNVAAVWPHLVPFRSPMYLQTW